MSKEVDVKDDKDVYGFEKSNLTLLGILGIKDILRETVK